MYNHWFWYFLGLINVISGLAFAADKQAAKNNRQRIPERNLHLLELLGGVFCNIMQMYTLRHKNRKFSYWAWTWIILIGWTLAGLHFYSVL